jgi:hypothetical protein
MSKSNALEEGLLRLIFNATDLFNIADNDAGGAITVLHVSLHTADPGEGGSLSTNEISYPGYARTTVPRTTGGWTVTGNSVSPVSDIVFPTATGPGGGFATHFGVGDNVDRLYYSGPITPGIACNNGVTPTLWTLSTITED